MWLFRCRLGWKFWSKINNRFLHICRRESSHMEELETKCCGPVKCRSRIPSHGINREWVNMGKATPHGYWDRNTRSNENVLRQSSGKTYCVESRLSRANKTYWGGLPLYPRKSPIKRNWDPVCQEWRSISRYIHKRIGSGSIRKKFLQVGDDRHLYSIPNLRGSVENNN
jgi:hypothetical protein